MGRNRLDNPTSEAKIGRILAILKPGKWVANSVLAKVSLRYGAIIHLLRHRYLYVIDTNVIDRNTGLVYYRLEGREE